MSIAESMTESARHWLAFAVESEARRLGLRASQARLRLASAIQESPGTLENLSRARLKRLDAALREKLRLSFLRAVEREIGLLENERDMAAALGRGDIGAGEVVAMDAHLAALRRIVAARKGGMNGESA